MARTSKKKSKSGDTSGFSLFGDPEQTEIDNVEELPKDEAGRQKIKKQYIDLLGIRVGKLKGRILNRERISKTQEGIYFICCRCSAICHNLDEGLVEDENNEKNICGNCHTTQTLPARRGSKTRAKGKRK